MITNRFEKDLLPRAQDTVDSNLDCKQLVKVTIAGYRDDPYADGLDFGHIRERLEQQYKIFDVLKDKMNHERHKKIGSPLYEYQMLSLILYCNGECNHNVCQSQRDDTYKVKWQCFDVALNEAIVKLGKFENHCENIYSGLAGVFLDADQVYSHTLAAYGFFFKTNVSFSRDLRVAKQFRGNEGSILSLNLERGSRCRAGLFGKLHHACDVSWISKFPMEQEVLVSKFTTFFVSPSKINQIGKKQWIVCNRGFDDVDETISFKKMFLDNNNVLN